MSERIQGVVKKEYNGVKYRSTLEARTAESLDKMGIPFAYESRRITLLEGFYSPFQTEKIRGIHYTPDFEIGPIMIECKGFETPEWRNKKKYIFKYLQENEPNTIYHQIHDNMKDLLTALDGHWTYLGYAIEVTSRKTSDKKTYESVSEAMDDLHLKGKNLGSIMRSLRGEKEWVYGYNWKLIKITL